MSLPTHKIKMLKCHFTQDEMTEFRDNLANSIMDLSSIEDEKKSVMSDYTAKINEKKAMINRVASNIRNGYEHREVKCRIDYDFTRRVKTFAREDTGEIVQEEVITADECQVEIPGLEPIEFEQNRIENEQDNQKELKKCSECEHHRAMNNPKHGVRIPGGYGKCIRPGGHCNPDQPTGFVHSAFDDFIDQMNAAKTADEGREILSAFEDRLEQLQRAAGVDPVCGQIDERTHRGFSTLTKKEINAICKAVSKADPGIGMIHTEIVEQWPAIKERWDKLYADECQKHFFKDSEPESNETEN